MRAQLLRRIADVGDAPLEFVDRDRPEPAAGEVLLRVGACGVCRTDLHVIEGDLTEANLPLVPGHQIVGVVEETGADCTSRSVGDRVGVGWLRGVDGTCDFCRSGRENLCADSTYTGYHEDGGYAEYAVAPEAYTYALPDEIGDADVAPLLCAGLIGYRALERAAVPDGGRLLLIGFGGSAHLVQQLALHRGHEVLVLTRSQGHIEHARELGASWAGSDADELPSLVESAILFAPAGRLVPVALEALAPGGTLSIAGIHLSEIPAMDYERHLFHEKQVRSVEANTRDDGRAFLAEAAEAGVRATVNEYALADANRALQDLKHSRMDGAGVLVPG